MYFNGTPTKDCNVDSGILPERTPASVEGRAGCPLNAPH